jgi:hypothetical protein
MASDQVAPFALCFPCHLFRSPHLRLHQLQPLQGRADLCRFGHFLPAA